MSNIKLKQQSSSIAKSVIKAGKIINCPECKEEIIDLDKDSYKCNVCQYQICMNCYKKIHDSYNHCPKCKTTYKSNISATQTSPVKANTVVENGWKTEPLRVKKIDKITINPTTIVNTKTASTKVVTKKEEEKAKNSLKNMSYAELAKVRVIQKNLVYVIGLAPQVATENILTKPEYFGQYGKITKIVVNKGNAYNPDGANGPSFSAYITYSNDIEASTAILAIDQFYIHDRLIRASYGTTKYCTFFLKEQPCPNSECLYLHSIGRDKDSFFKDDILSNKNIFLDQQKLAIAHIQKHLPNILKSENTKKKTIFPNISSILQKIQQYGLEEEKGSTTSSSSIMINTNTTTQKSKVTLEEEIKDKENKTANSKTTTVKNNETTTTSSTKAIASAATITIPATTVENISSKANDENKNKDDTSLSSNCTNISSSKNENNQVEMKDELNKDTKDNIPSDTITATNTQTQKDQSSIIKENEKNENLNSVKNNNMLNEKCDQILIKDEVKIEDESKINIKEIKVEAVENQKLKKSTSSPKMVNTPPIATTTTTGTGTIKGINEETILDHTDKNMTYNNDYDKKIIESLLSRISNSCDQKGSRFQFAQNPNSISSSLSQKGSPYTTSTTNTSSTNATNETNNNNNNKGDNNNGDNNNDTNANKYQDNNEEYNFLSKSIQEFILLQCGNLNQNNRGNIYNSFGDNNQMNSQQQQQDNNTKCEFNFNNVKFNNNTNTNTKNIFADNGPSKYFRNLENLDKFPNSTITLNWSTTTNEDNSEQFIYGFNGNKDAFFNAFNSLGYQNQFSSPQYNLFNVDFPSNIFSNISSHINGSSNANTNTNTSPNNSTTNNTNNNNNAKQNNNTTNSGNNSTTNNNSNNNNTKNTTNKPNVNINVDTTTRTIGNIIINNNNINVNLNNNINLNNTYYEIKQYK